MAASTTSRKGIQATFNILFSNTQTILPALYGRTPRPDVRPRFQAKTMQAPVPPQPVGVDELGQPVADLIAQQQFMAGMAAYQAKQAQAQLHKDAATVIERCLAYSMSEYDFDNTMRSVLLDYLLTGRGVPRIRYEPLFRPSRIPVMAGPDGAYVDQQGQPIEQEPLNDIDGEYIEGPEELQYENVRCELVHWDDFRVWPARSWGEVPAVAFRHRLTREQLVEQFGEIGASVPLTEDVVDPDDDTGNNDRQQEDKTSDSLKRGLVWEIWYKPTRTVVFIAPMLKHDVPLKEVPDPYTLGGFFPVPRPLYSVTDTASLIPCPEYVIYEDQANEIDVLTRRINATVKAIKYRGIYNGAAQELASLLTAADNKMIAAQNFDALTDLAKQVLILPIDGPIKALNELYKAREQAKQVIYEVTGLADIIRGSTEASETATAQDIKSRWGSLRIQDRRREVERMVVDLLRMKADVMASLFAPETLSAMSDMPVGPEMIALLRDDGLRNYRIDVETDSMVAQNRAADQEAMNGLLQGVVSYMTGMAPLVASGAVPMEAAKAMLLAAVKLYPSMGREVEDALNQIQAPSMPAMPMGAQPPQVQPQAQQAPNLRVIPGGAPPNMVPA